MSENQWQYDFEEYIKNGEPGQSEKSAAWQTAIGLQDVDGLQTSDYLHETAKAHIEGLIDIKTAQRRIESYYEARGQRKSNEQQTKEADIVSARITELLEEKTFQFSPVEWQMIHRRLFSGIFDQAGKLRTYNITKKEWVLNGETVTYAFFGSLKETMDYDFSREKEFDYSGLSVREAIRHIAKFTADIWQIHPFCEGNTRATAVFIIKYLRSFGFDIKNNVFADNSWYFRNALVRANYNDLKNNIHATTEFLDLFFENLILESKNDLKNRFMHVLYSETSEKKKDDEDELKGNNCTLNCTLNELAVLKAIKKNPTITQKSLAEIIGKSERTVKMITAALKEKGILIRTGSKKSGKWEIKADID